MSVQEQLVSPQEVEYSRLAQSLGQGFTTVLEKRGFLENLKGCLYTPLYASGLLSSRVYYSDVQIEGKIYFLKMHTFDRSSRLGSLIGQTHLFVEGQDHYLTFYRKSGDVHLDYFEGKQPLFDWKTIPTMEDLQFFNQALNQLQRQ